MHVLFAIKNVVFGLFVCVNGVLTLIEHMFFFILSTLIKIIKTHYECPYRIEIFHQRGRNFS